MRRQPDQMRISAESLNKIMVSRSKRAQLVIINLPDLWGTSEEDTSQQRDVHVVCVCFVMCPQGTCHTPVHHGCSGAWVLHRDFPGRHTMWGEGGGAGRHRGWTLLLLGFSVDTNTQGDECSALSTDVSLVVKRAFLRELFSVFQIVPSRMSIFAWVRS